MTIPSETSKITATGTGATATYPYTFKIFAEEDLTVTVKLISTGVETTLTLTTDYTVSGVGTVAGGNVTLVNASQAWLDGSGFLTSGYTITIERIVLIKQLTSVTSQNSYLPEFAEKAYDKLTMICQQLKSLLVNCLHLPATETGNTASTTFPVAADRANTILAFDSSGNPTTAELSSVGANAAATFVTLSTDASLTNERVLTGTADQVVITDNGPGGTVVLSTPQSIGTGSSPTFANITDSGLTAGRVAFAGTAGILETDAGLLYDKTTDILTVTGGVKTTPAAAPGSPANGQQWSDSTQVSPAYRTGGMTEYGVRCIYAQSTNVTVANTATITTLMTTPDFGTATIAGNYWTVGKTIRATAWGNFGITGTPTLTINFLRAAASLFQIQITTAAASGWKAEAIVRCTAVGAGTGNLATTGVFLCGTNAGASPFVATQGRIDVGSLDTTGSGGVSFTATWGTANASNTITCSGITLEVIG